MLSWAQDVQRHLPAHGERGSQDQTVESPLGVNGRRRHSVCADRLPSGALLPDGEREL